MTEPFANSSRRWTAVVLVVAAAVWLCYGGVKHALASHYGASSSSSDWPRAAEIEPSSAENWYRLGRYRQLDFDHPDLKLAISYYRRAVELDPPSPFYKLDLATALEVSGDDAEAEKYFRAARANYPISAEVSWRFGGGFLALWKFPSSPAAIAGGLRRDSSGRSRGPEAAAVGCFPRLAQQSRCSSAAQADSAGHA